MRASSDENTSKRRCDDNSLGDLNSPAGILLPWCFVMTKTQVGLNWYLR